MLGQGLVKIWRVYVSRQDTDFLHDPAAGGCKRCTAGKLGRNASEGFVRPSHFGESQLNLCLKVLTECLGLFCQSYCFTSGLMFESLNVCQIFPQNKFLAKYLSVSAHQSPFLSDCLNFCLATFQFLSDCLGFCLDRPQRFISLGGGNPKMRAFLENLLPHSQNSRAVNKPTKPHDERLDNFPFLGFNCNVFLNYSWSLSLSIEWVL